MKKLSFETLLRLLDDCKFGIIITNSEGVILWANHRYSQMAGFDIHSFIGQNIELISEQGLVELDGPTLYSQLIQIRDEITAPVHYYTNNDFIATSATPYFDEHDELEYIFYTFTNCSEVIRTQNLLTQIRNRNLALETQMNELQTQNLLSNDIIVSDITMQQIYRMAARLASVTASVMILGESGVGKDVYAKYIHTISPRKHHNFIHVNLGAIPANLFESELFGYEPGAFTGASKNGKVGLIELANEGTLFLDEVGELNLDIQAKLLQVVQDRALRRIGGTESIPLDIRIISATNRDLEQMVKDGTFRLDLYYRLNVIPVKIPPLRERRSEIPLLANKFLEIFNQKYEMQKLIDTDVYDVFRNYNWPGNIRELNHVIENLVVITRNDLITLSDLPQTFQAVQQSSKFTFHYDEDFNLRDTLANIEKALITEVLNKYKTTTAAAQVMGIDISTLSKKRKKYDI